MPKTVKKFRYNKITCIQLSGEFPDFTHRSMMPHYGLPLIGTILSGAGYDVVVYIEHIKRPEWSRIAESDLVCFSTLSVEVEKMNQLAKEIKLKLGIPIIVGGTHATYFPETVLEFCDYVVLGEGDETILELIDTLTKGEEVGKVPGIAYRVNNQIHWTAPRQGPSGFDTIPNLSLISGYRKLSVIEKIIKRKIPLLTVQSSRGCSYKCSFCITNTMFPAGYRKRDIESVIRDMRDKRHYGRKLMFVDNEFALMPSYTKKLLRRMIEENFGFDIILFARVEAANDDELLSLMRKAGVNRIYQGYESVNPKTLIEYKKCQTIDKIITAIKKLHSFGFRISGSFVTGADTENLETIRDTVNFVIEQEITVAYFFSIWGHYPEKMRGCKTIIPWYRSIFKGWHYQDGNFVTHFPLRMRPSELQKALIDAHYKVVSPAQILLSLKRHKYSDAREKIFHLYMYRTIKKALLEYIPFLEDIEYGLYDSGGNLQQELLIKRVQKDNRYTFQAGSRTINANGLSKSELPIFEKRNITCFS